MDGDDRDQRSADERDGGEAARVGPEPFLGYDGLPTDEVLSWIEGADPETEQLKAIFDYESSQGAREAVLHELKERLRRSGLRPPLGQE